MKLNPTAMAMAAASAAAILWTLCYLIVLMLPGWSMRMSSYMMHADFSGMQWQMGIGGFAFGLLLWVIASAFLGWLVAVLYNRFLS